ncbi:lipocalin family protein [Zunongwangia sp. F260]|uniref:Lipocalin family protein n=1 Tax=Autumnicola lenta TaxID=3075593 RepID=A0ABU3CKW6_9FLAO|nr:lipocalin family protein [Zunongwangia sp. F260]MDT0646986.1 lipocalin family protein [Zunongwangia sp. F260]
MKLKQATQPFILIVLLSILTGCSKSDTPMDSEKNIASNVVITPSNLYGEWGISKLITDTPVDLNGDGSLNTNILLETNCFKSMAITFKSNSKFTTTNSQMNFEAGTDSDAFACLEDRKDRGSWQIEGNKLTLNISIDGEIYSQTKTISLNDGKFEFDVSRMESAAYVNDPGTTDASGITIISIEYEKKAD